jgi:hypothetical protein
MTQQTPTRIPVSADATSDARYRMRLSLATTIVVLIAVQIAIHWLFMREIHENSWRNLLLTAIPAYLCIYGLSMLLIRSPKFEFVEVSEAGIRFHPLTLDTIPWSAVNVIRFETDTQAGFGTRVRFEIKREYYKTIKSKQFDFAKHEMRNIFACHITFSTDTLDRSHDNLEELIDRYAPDLKSKMPTG